VLRNGRKIKILIADNHCIMRYGITQVIHNNFRNPAILEAEDSDEAMQTATDNPDIDIFILDYYLPGNYDTELLARLKNTYPDTPVIFISSIKEYELIKNVLDKGAAGFIPKSTPPQVIAQAINLVLAGGTYIPKFLLEYAHQYTASRHNQNPELTRRQRQILNLIATGLTDKEIADKLNVSPYTIKAHTTSMRNLLGAKNRTMAVESARKLGLIG